MVSWVLVALMSSPGARAGASQWSLVALLDGRNDLAGDARAHARDFLGYHGAAQVAVQVVTGGDAATGWRGWRRCGGQPAGAEPAAEPLGGLREFAGWAVAVAGARKLAVALLAHGLPPGEAGPPLARVLASGAADPGASVGDVLRQIAEGARGRPCPPLDMLVLESCFGCSLDTLSEAQGVARALVGVPGEIRSPGIRWESVLCDLDRREWDWRGSVSAGFWMGEGDGCHRPPEALTYVDVRHAPRMIARLRAMCRAAQAEPVACLKAALWARSRSQVGRRLRQMVDADDLAAGLEAHAEGAALRSSAASFSRALRRGTGAAGGSPGSGGIGCGLTLYLEIPLSLADVRRYVGLSVFAAETGYSGFLDVVAERAGSTSGPLPWLGPPAIGASP
jgi:hypothetical protein